MDHSPTIKNCLRQNSRHKKGPNGSYYSFPLSPTTSKFPLVPQSSNKS